MTESSVHATEKVTSARAPIGLFEAFLFWLKLGFISFGEGGTDYL